MQDACFSNKHATCILHAGKLHACCMLATYNIHVTQCSVLYISSVPQYIAHIYTLINCSIHKDAPDHMKGTPVKNRNVGVAGLI